MGNLFSSLMKLSLSKKNCSSETLLHSLKLVFARHLCALIFDFPHFCELFHFKSFNLFGEYV